MSPIASEPPYDLDGTTVTELEDEVDSVTPLIPDGGTRAWLCVFGGFLGTFVTFGYLNSYGVWQEYYSRTTLANKTASEISWIGAFQYFLTYAPAAPIGQMFDRGYYRTIFIIGASFMVVSQMLLSLCKEYYQYFLAQGIGLGLGYGAVFTVAVTCPTHHFMLKRGTAIGIVACGASLGGVVFPIAIVRLIPLLGAPWTTRIIGFVQIALLGSSYLFLSTLMTPSKKAFSHRTLVDREALRDPAYVAFVAGCSCLMFGLYTPFTYINTFSEQYNIPANGYYISILNAASLFGRLIPGMLADRFGKIQILIPHVTLAGILLFVFPYCQNLGGLVTFCVFYGFASGCVVALTTACSAQLGHTSTVGARNGTTFFSMSFGGLFGVPLSGALLGMAGGRNWIAMASASGGFVVIGAAFLTRSWWLQTRGKKVQGAGSGVIEEPTATAQAAGLRDMNQGSTVEKAETSMQEHTDGLQLSTMNGKRSKGCGLRGLEDNGKA